MAIGDKYLKPEEGWIRYTDDDKLIYYDADWEKYSAPGADLDSYTRATASGNIANFLFVGTDIRLVAPINSNLSSNMSITIDGVTEEYSINNPTLDWSINRFEKLDLENKIHEVTITSGDKISIIDCIDVKGYLIPKLSRDYEFPVKIGNAEDVQEYAASLIGGEEQLLITREDGSIYVTDGNGSYIQCGVSKDKYDALEKRVIELENIIKAAN